MAFSIVALLVIAGVLVAFVVAIVTALLLSGRSPRDHD